MTKRSTRRLLVALLTALAVAASAPASATVLESRFYSFENGFQGWTPDHQIDCEQDPEPCTFQWSITPSTEQAQHGTTSLKAVLNGLNDDGTIWLERRFNVEPGTEVLVELSFWLWSETQSDFNTWPVVAFIGKRNPELETDFRIVGQTDQQPGWTQYRLTRTVHVGGGGKLWVAFGFGATWESERTHYLDAARVRITALEPTEAEAARED